MAEEEAVPSQTFDDLFTIHQDIKQSTVIENVKCEEKINTKEEYIEDYFEENVSMDCDDNGGATSDVFDIFKKLKESTTEKNLIFDAEPPLKKAKRRIQFILTENDCSKLNIFRKYNPDLPKYMESKDTNPLYVQFNNYLINVPNLSYNSNYEDLKMAEIVTDTKIILCKHIYIVKNVQTRAGDEAFTAITVCIKCGFTKITN